MAMEKMQSRGDLLPGCGGWRLAVVCVLLVCFQAAAVYCIWMNASEIALAVFAVQAMLFAPASVCYWNTKDFNPAFVFEHSINEWSIGFACLFLPELKKLPRQEKFECIAALIKDAEYKYSLYKMGIFSWLWWFFLMLTVLTVWSALTEIASFANLDTSALPSSIWLSTGWVGEDIMSGGGFYLLCGVIEFVIIKRLIRGGKLY